MCVCASVCESFVIISVGRGCQTEANHRWQEAGTGGTCQNLGSTIASTDIYMQNIQARGKPPGNRAEIRERDEVKFLMNEAIINKSR